MKFVLPNPFQIQILCHKKSPPQDFNRRTLVSPPCWLAVTTPSKGHRKWKCTDRNSLYVSSRVTKSFGLELNYIVCTYNMLWQYGLSSFQEEENAKLERFLPKNQYTHRKLLILENWCNGEVPKFDFQSHFSMSKIIEIFLNFCFIEKYQFRSTFFVIDIF
jgi:hypothetical protein